MFGLHVMPPGKVGSVALREGPLMANVASVFIIIKGKASHGAFPHEGIDAICAAFFGSRTISSDYQPHKESQ